MTDTKAVIELGGKQHLIAVGDKVVVNQLADKENDTIKLTDMLNGLAVELKVLSHSKGDKVRGLKFHSKSRYTKRYGHRQPFTTLEVLTVGKTERATAPASKGKKKVVRKTSTKTEKPKSVKKATTKTTDKETKK